MAPLQQVSAPHRTCHELLVEDDPLVMAGTYAMLDDLGHSVTEATTGEAALAALNDEVELVPTDYAMPAITVLELAERVHVMRPTLPVLLASGHAGANLSRLAKPYPQVESANAIAKLLTPTCEPASEVA